MVTPVHDQHLPHAALLVKSMLHFARDRLPRLYLVVSNSGGRQDSIASTCQVRNDTSLCTFPFVQTVSAQWLLQRAHEPWPLRIRTHGYLCGRHGPRNLSQYPLGTGRILQGLKKLFEVAYAHERGCERAWVVDAESFAFRPFFFEPIFSRPAAFVLRYADAPHHPELESWQACHRDLFAAKLDLVAKHSTPNFPWPSDTRTRPQLDFWVFPAVVAVQLTRLLRREHGSVALSWTAPPALGEVSYIDPFLLYSVQHLGNPFDVELINVRPLFGIGRFRRPCNREEAQALNELPIHSVRGDGLAWALEAVLQHGWRASWCTSNCDICVICGAMWRLPQDRRWWETLCTSCKK